MTDRQSVHLSREAGIARVHLDRPDKRNALSRDMLRMVGEAFAEADADDSIRVIVLSGADPDFCAGFDLGELPSGESNEARTERERVEFFGLGMGIRNTDKPTVASIQGACVAGGLLISLTCDLIVMSDDAYLYNPLTRMGGVGLELLLEPWDIGFRRAKKYLFTAERIPAPVALEIGLASEVVARKELASATSRLAQRIAEMPPVTLRLLKRSMNYAQDQGGMKEGLTHHFGIHQQGHESSESQALLHDARHGKPLKEYFQKRDAGKL